MAPQRKRPLPDEANEDRRKFLASCGRFAAVTPPAITMLLSTSLSSEAIAHSGGRGHWGGPGRKHRDWDDRPGRGKDWNRDREWDWDRGRGRGPRRNFPDIWDD